MYRKDRHKQRARLMFRSDAHKILGTNDKMSDEEIKKKYQRLRSLYHPDKNPGKEEENKKKFEAVQEAMETIEGKATPPPNSGFRPQQGGNYQTHYVNPEDIAEFLKNFQQNMHGRGPDSRPRPDKIDDYQDSWGSSGPGAKSHNRTQVMNAVIIISLEEAFNGCTKDINVPQPGAIAAHQPHKVTIPPGASEADI